MAKYLAMGLGTAVLLTLTAAFGLGEMAMQLSSSAFKDGGKIPVQNVMPGAGGKNLSLPLSWAGAPAGVKSFALSIIDLHPVAHKWVHWVVINLPADTASLAEGASGKKMPPAAVELLNSFGQSGYGGPQPPRGTGDHPYIVTLYALSVPKVEIGGQPDAAAFNRALQGKILAQATITGYFGR